MPRQLTSDGLVEAVERGLALFVEAARDALGQQLVAIVLYGSAAAGQVRPTSDVNVIVVLRSFDVARIDALREPMRAAHAAIQLEAMLVLESELPLAIESFADKFADVARRRRVLYGSDPFASRMPSRRAQLQRLRQALLNLVLRLRNRYAITSLREEQATVAIAEAAGPMRALAATLCALEGVPARDPKQALLAMARSLGAPTDWFALVSQARETRLLPEGQAATVLLRMIDLATSMHERAMQLDEAGP